MPAVVLVVVAEFMVGKGTERPTAACEKRVVEQGRCGFIYSP